MKETTDDVCLVDLPPDLNNGISSYVNTKDLVAYVVPNLSPLLSPPEPCVNPPGENPCPPPPPNLHPFSQADKTKFIMGSDLISILNGEERKYLVKWKVKLEIGEVLLDIEELQQVDQDF